MKRPPLRLQHGLLFAMVALAFFAWGAWLARGPQPAEPLPWLAQWREDVLQPLAEERLRLAGLRALVGGQLWLQPRPEGVRLLYRGDWLAAGEPWRLEAELALQAAERASLLAAAGPTMAAGEQPLGDSLLAQLDERAIEALLLAPQGDVPVARLVASLGQPRLRLQLAAGEAWVYPELGVRLLLDGEHLRQLQAGPRRALQAR